MKYSLCLFLTFLAIYGYAQPLTDEITIIKHHPTEDVLAVGYKSGKIELYSLNPLIKLLGSTNQIASESDTKKDQILSIDFLNGYPFIFVLFEHNRLAFLSTNDCSVMISNGIHINLMHYSRRGDEIVKLSDFDFNSNLLAISGNTVSRISLIDLNKLYDLCERRFTPLITTRKCQETELVGGFFNMAKTEEDVHGSILGILEAENASAPFSCLKIAPGGNEVYAGTEAGKLYKWRVDKSNLPDLENCGHIDPCNYKTISNARAEYKDRSLFSIDMINNTLVSSCMNNPGLGNLQFWDTALLHLYHFSDAGLYKKLQLSADENYLATSSNARYRLLKKINGTFTPVSNFLRDNPGIPHSQKHTVEFIGNDTLALANGTNIYFYKLPSISLLYTLRPVNHPLTQTLP